MNQDLLRVFETESDYDSAKDGFVYPTVSYVRDVDEVYYMDKPLLPMIDTTGYATKFTLGEYYPQEALVFKAIYDMYASQIPEEGSYYLGIMDGQLFMESAIGGSYGTHNICDVSNEPLYKEYLINFYFMHMFDGGATISAGGYPTLRYEDGLAYSVPM